MTDELEVAAKAAAEHGAAAIATAEVGPARTRKSRPATLSPDTAEGVCTNCETKLLGNVCHVCGQVDDAYHRPVLGLISETFEGLTSMDGRVARTIPHLMIRPGRVTRAFLKGRRAQYIPPFRLYIIASLIFFLLIPAMGSFASNDAGNAQLAGTGSDESRAQLAQQIDEALASGDLSEAEAEQARAWLGAIPGFVDLDVPEPEIDLDGSAQDPVSVQDPVSSQADDEPDTGPPNSPEEESPSALNIGEEGKQDIRRAFVPEDYGGEPSILPLPKSARAYLAERLIAVIEDPERWFEQMQAWIPRIMFVMVPIYALLLSLVYIWRRGFFYFDHLIVSIHLHAALYLAMSLGMLISYMFSSPWVGPVLLIYANVYLYRLHRVVYQRGVFASVMRTLTLDFLYMIVLFIGLLVVAILGMLT